MNSWLTIEGVREFRPEAPEEFGLPVACGDIPAALRFGNGARRAQWLTWRGIVRKHLGGETGIEYADNGAPRLRDIPYNISVTHSRSYAAVICSPGPCAIDIEQLDRRFDRIASRYLTPPEEELAGEDLRLFRAAAWCTKETLYKYDGRTDTEFLRDLHIMDFRPAEGIIEARIRDGAPLLLRFLTFDGHALTYLCDETPLISRPANA